MPWMTLLLMALRRSYRSIQIHSDWPRLLVLISGLSSLWAIKVLACAQYDFGKPSSFSAMKQKAISRDIGANCVATSLA
jgi:hypothetical protein